MDNHQNKVLLKTCLVLGVILGVVAIGLCAWYLVAEHNLTELRQQGNAHLARVAAARAAIVDGQGRIAAGLRLESLTGYIQAVNAETGTVRDCVAAMRRGDGTGFWLEAERTAHAKRWEVLLNWEIGLAREAYQAARAIEGLYLATGRQTAGSGQARAAAVSALNASSDGADFERCLEGLQACRGGLVNTLGLIGQNWRNASLQGPAEGFRRSVLRTIDGEVRREIASVDVRLSRTRQALAALESHKERMSAQIARQASTLAEMERFSAELLPLAETAFQKTRPLREFFQEAEKPIFGGELGGMLGQITSLFGNRGSSGEPMSALSIATSIDPTTKTTVDLLKGICDGIETAHGELQGIQQVGGPLNSAFREYNGSRSRQSMLTLVSSTQDASAYFASKSTIFNPLLEKLEGGRRYTRFMYEMAERVRLPGASRLLNQCAEAADDLIGTAETPFLQAGRMIRHMSDGLSDVGSQEAQYQALLRQLAAD